MNTETSCRNVFRMFQDVAERAGHGPLLTLAPVDRASRGASNKAYSGASNRASSGASNRAYSGASNRASSGASITLSYADAMALSARLASALVALGVRPGDRVAAQVDKSPQALLLYLAALRQGAIYLPLNTAYTATEIAYFLSDAAPVLFVASSECMAANEEALNRHTSIQRLTLEADGSGSLMALASEQTDRHRIQPRRGDDVALILYTSGTTGSPKGAMLTHANLASNARALTRLWEFTSSDVLLHALPLFHAHGLVIATHCVLLSGGRMLLLPRFDADTVVQLLPEATVMMGVPTFYSRLLEHPDLGAATASGMRLFISGSAPLSEATARRFYALTGHTILERYGMTEATIISSNPVRGERRLGSVGLPVEGVSLRIVDDHGTPLARGDVGHLQITGPAVMKGYWRQPQKTRQEFTTDGWFRTGDNGRINEDGYLTIVGRSKDVIISGGYNVYPGEVEALLDALEGIGESAVIGLPHPDFGEAVTAVVVAAASATPDEAAIRRHLRDVLAAYKVPKRVLVADDLPRNTMGKVVKAELRDIHRTLYLGPSAEGAQ